MNYKLIENSLNDMDNPKKTVLLNRGIDDWMQYLNLTEDCIHDYGLLKNIDKAVECLKIHISNSSNIHIIVDPDVDGYASASMVYRYIRYIEPSIRLSYSLHTKKQHGITEDIEIPDDCNLLIIPDAGSNDVEECMRLSEKCMDIIILDHHICSKYMYDDYAIVVNNQNCDYPNKNFSGAGIVYKFLKALDDDLWEDIADTMLDMVALANISDVMDMREYETKYYVDAGLSRIRSKLFKALIDKQSYSMDNVVNITSVQFYITPILNAMIRMGSQEDKDLLFRAFIETDETFKYKKRGMEEEIDEDIYTRAARLCYNAKGRQTKEVQKSTEELSKLVEGKKICGDKVMFVNATDILGETLTGLVAMKLSEKYNRPCLLLRKQKDIDGVDVYGGSCRNFDNSPIRSLKNLLDSTEKFRFVQGHDNAAGISIESKNIPAAIELCNHMLSDVNLEKCFSVDFELDADNLTIGFMKDINDMKDIFGQGIKEPLIHLSGISIYNEDLYLMGKSKNTWKVITDNGYAVIKFNATEDDPVLSAYKESECECSLGKIDVIGTVYINNYKGILTPQIIVKDYELRR